MWASGAAGDEDRAAGQRDPAFADVLCGELRRGLAHPVELRRCRDVVWSMTDGMLWHRLVEERGWSNDRFAEWLGHVWVDRLVTKQRRSSR